MVSIERAMDPGKLLISRIEQLARQNAGMSSSENLRGPRKWTIIRTPYMATSRFFGLEMTPPLRRCTGID